MQPQLPSVARTPEGVPLFDENHPRDRKPAEKRKDPESSRSAEHVDAAVAVAAAASRTAGQVEPVDGPRISHGSPSIDVDLGF